MYHLNKAVSLQKFLLKWNLPFIAHRWFPLINQSSKAKTDVWPEREGQRERGRETFNYLMIIMYSGCRRCRDGFVRLREDQNIRAARASHLITAPRPSLLFAFTGSAGWSAMSKRRWYLSSAQPETFWCIPYSHPYNSAPLRCRWWMCTLSSTVHAGIFHNLSTNYLWSISVHGAMKCLQVY